MPAIKGLFTAIKSLIAKELAYKSVKADYALLFITFKCTSCCEMCTIWKRGQNHSAEEELSLQDWENIIDKLLEENILYYELFGGDSLLRKDLTIPLIKYIKRKKESAFIDLPTNCKLLDRNTAKQLVESGLDRIYISLDGPNEIHDKIRGSSGTFISVRKALDYLVDAKKDLNSKTPSIMINCTISALNIYNFEEILPIINKTGIDGIDFEYVGEFKDENINDSDVEGIKPKPFYISPVKSNLLNRQEAVLLKRKIKDIKKSAVNYEFLISTRHIDSLRINDLINGTIPNKKCYICHSMVTVDPFGNVMGCLHYNNYLYGNIADKPFKKIWNNRKHRIFMNYQSAGRIKICSNCISGVIRNSTLYQTILRSAYFKIKGKGLDSP